MPRKPQPPSLPSRRDHLQACCKQTWTGDVEAATEAEAIEKAAAKFKQYAPRLMAVPHA
jgi:hypothetical protein